MTTTNNNSKNNNNHYHQKPRLKKLVVNDIVSMKKREKISVITSYDYWSAKICDSTGIDIILVGFAAISEISILTKENGVITASDAFNKK